MKISYYPGCTLKTKAKELDVTARLCAKALGVEMEEIENSIRKIYNRLIFDKYIKWEIGFYE